MTGKTLENRKFKMFIVCIIGICLNMTGSGIVKTFHLPIYLDTVGTIAVSVMSGYLPGIIVGLATNMLEMFFVSETYVYYAFVNVMVAVIASAFAQKGLMKKPIGLIVFVFIISSIGGGHETLLTWVKDEFATGRTPLLSTILHNCLSDVMDKAISVMILIILMVILPKKFQSWLVTEGWQQTPLTREEIKAAKKTHNRVVSLRTKILLLLMTACVTIGLIAMIISTILFRQATIEEHIKVAKNAAALAASQINPEMIDEYIQKGEAAKGYIQTEKLLYQIRESSPDIEFIYAYKMEKDGCHVVFDLDTEEFKGHDPGYVESYESTYEPDIPKFLAGEEIEPKISNDSYGWLITAFEPVYDEEGNCVCYAAADISMGVILHKEISFLVKLLSLFLGFFILVIAIGLWLSEYNIVFPVNTMAISAGAFMYDSEEALEENVEHMKKLDIHTGDEIENMYRAFTKTTENNVHYLNDLQNKTETIAKMQDSLIMVLADMVESRDENTGDHVRKTAAYTRIIMNKLRELGYYADELTDQFMFDVERSAPLHDIGKIAISDTILNKPGKLTDEEFEIMKTHTICGAEVIDQTIKSLPESGYLEQARNIAMSHHEKWNGKGYPQGLAGEDIPLAARIMAVADVFDALVSERCYKKAFPFEKAMDIIKQDAGTHFDPKVAEAFISSADEVSAVMERLSEAIPNKKK